MKWKWSIEESGGRAAVEIEANGEKALQRILMAMYDAMIDDPEQFPFREDQFGFGTPPTLTPEFTPEEVNQEEEGLVLPPTTLPPAFTGMKAPDRKPLPRRYVEAKKEPTDGQP